MALSCINIVPKETESSELILASGAVKLNFELQRASLLECPAQKQGIKNYTTVTNELKLHYYHHCNKLH